MKDKEKQIEKILEKVGIRYGIDVGGIDYIVNAHKLASYLQPKLSKDSVILSKKEYENLQSNVKRLAYQNCNLKIENKNLEEDLEIKTLKNKEIVEKILNKVRAMLWSCNTIREHDEYTITPNIGYLMKDVDDGLDEIEKEFSVVI